MLGGVEAVVDSAGTGLYYGTTSHVPGSIHRRSLPIEGMVLKIECAVISMAQSTGL